MSDHHVATEPSNEGGVKTIKAYLIGFSLSLILTLLAFGLVAYPIYSPTIIYVGLAVLAIVQLLVQVIFFLRLNVRTEQDRWNLMAFVFTLLVVAILVAGSLWIMYNLNYNMMN